MNNTDKQYLQVLKKIILEGEIKESRAGYTRSIFGVSMRFNLKKGLPLLTTKKVFYKGIIHELLWFLSGSTNIRYLVENNVHIWDDDAYRYYNTEIKDKLPDKGVFKTKEEFLEGVLAKKEFIYPQIGQDFNKFVEDPWTHPVYNLYKAGDLGPVYGRQWRHFGVNRVDQITEIINTLKNNPDSRRIILNAWNPSDLKEMALPPCHVLYQFSTRVIEGDKRELSCCFFMRSNDFTNGNPFNIAQAAILTHLLAHVCDMEVGELIYFGGDVHVYENNVKAAKEQLTRKGSEELPKLKINADKKNIFDIRYEDLEIVDYYPDPPIKYNLNVG